jgi:hypothetical protein
MEPFSRGLEQAAGLTDCGLHVMTIAGLKAAEAPAVAGGCIYAADFAGYRGELQEKADCEW